MAAPDQELQIIRDRTEIGVGWGRVIKFQTFAHIFYFIRPEQVAQRIRPKKLGFYLPDPPAPAQGPAVIIYPAFGAEEIV